MSLSLYTVERVASVDEYDSFTVYAEDPDDARYLAKQRAYMRHGQLAKEWTDLIEVDPQGWDDADVLSIDTVRGIVSSSFHGV